jgi:hypothetical protein
LLLFTISFTGATATLSESNLNLGGVDIGKSSSRLRASTMRLHGSYEKIPLYCF